jgi:hypothetical protein
VAAQRDRARRGESLRPQVAPDGALAHATGVRPAR